MALDLIYVRRLQQAGFEEVCRLEDFDCSAQITMDRRLLDAVFSLDFLARRWLGLFDDPILGNSALGRLANASYQRVIEASSYRQRLSPQPQGDVDVVT